MATAAIICYRNKETTMSDSDDNINNPPTTFTDPQPFAPKKFIPPASSHASIQQRILQKRINVLKFLASETWSSMKILTHVLQLGKRQTQATLSSMAKDKLLKVEVLVDGSRIYGITESGLSLVDASEYCRAFQLGKTPILTVPHYLLSQKVRIDLEQHYQLTDWVSGKQMYRNKFFKKIPDGSGKFENYTVATEVELNLKTKKFAKEMFGRTEQDLGPIDDYMTLLHLVIYFTPHVNRMQGLVDRFVSPKNKNRFLVCALDKNIEAYKKDDQPLLNDELYNFLRKKH
jgi:hypothetical protein